MRQPLPPISADSGIDDLEPEASEPPHLEGYRLISRLGRGGMGSVWRAVQLSTRREVAVKLMTGAAFGSARVRARFEREIELCSRLDHPHIASIYAGGLHTGIYFYVMQLIEGEHLDQYIRRRQPSRSERLALLGQVCDAVQHAHQRGVVHRDLKPSNILIDAQGQPHIVDFGLAKAIRDVDAVDPSVTIEGVVGTMAYMPPEQAAGGHAQVGPPSDVYALGVVAYEALLGRRPRPIEGSSLQQQRLAAECEPLAPRRVERGFSRDLEAVLLKAMVRRPADRYAVAGELGAELRRVLDGEPVQARPLTVGYFLRKRVRKHWPVVAATAAVMLVLAAVTIWSYVAIGQQRDVARRHADASQRALYQNRIAMARRYLERHELAPAIAQLDACPQHLRHWEWRRLRWLADQSEQTLQLASNIVGAAWRGQDRRLVVLTSEGRLHVYTDAGALRLDVATPLRSHSAAISDDGRWLIGNDGDQTLLIETRGGETVARLPPAEQYALAADGSCAAMADGHDLAVRSLPDGALRWRTRLEHKPSLLAVHESGQAAAAAVGLRVFGPTGEPWADLLEVGPVALQWTASGRSLAILGSAGWQIWDARRRALSAGGDWAGQTARGGLIRSDGKRLAAWTDSHAIVAVDPVTGSTVLRRGHDGPIFAGCLAEGDELWTATFVGSVKRWSLNQPGEDFAVLPTQRLVDTAWNAQRGVALALLASGQIVQVSLDNDVRTIGSLGDRQPSRVAAMSPDGRSVAIVDDGRLALIDLASGSIRRGGPLTGQAVQLDWSDCGRWIGVACIAEVRAMCFNAATLDAVALWPGATGPFFSPSGEVMAWVTESDRVVHIGRPDDADPSRHYLGAPPNVISVAMSADGRWLAAAGERAIVVWDRGLRRPVAKLMHAEPVAPMLAFSADGRRLVGGGRTLRVWEAPTLNELAQLPVSGQGQLEVRFVSNDQAIVFATRRGVQTWSDGVR